MDSCSSIPVTPMSTLYIYHSAYKIKLNDTITVNQYNMILKHTNVQCKIAIDFQLSIITESANISIQSSDCGIIANGILEYSNDVLYS